MIFRLDPSTKVLPKNRNKIEITVAVFNEPGNNLHLIILYRSPSKVSFRILLETLHLIHHDIAQNQPTVIIGDFNVGILDESSEKKILLSEMKNLGYAQLITEPTTKYGSILDHVTLISSTQLFILES